MMSFGGQLAKTGPANSDRLGRRSWDDGALFPPDLLRSFAFSAFPTAGSEYHRLSASARGESVISDVSHPDQRRPGSLLCLPARASG